MPVARGKALVRVRMKPEETARTGASEATIGWDTGGLCERARRVVGAHAWGPIAGRTTEPGGMLEYARASINVMPSISKPT